MFKKIATNDNAVKTIFDHFRNVGIAGAIAAVGIWTFKHPSSGLLTYVSYASAVALLLLAAFLLVLNERHGHRKFEEANAPWPWQIAVRLIYGLTLVSLFTGPAVRS